MRYEKQNAHTIHKFFFHIHNYIPPPPSPPKYLFQPLKSSQVQPLNPPRALFPETLP